MIDGFIFLCYLKL